MHRRFFIQSLSWSLGTTFGSSMLTACEKPRPVFHGIDLTGSKYGADFRLHGSDGREHALSDFKGQYILLFFGFTQCPDVCPTILTRAVNTRQLLGKDANKVKVLFVTIDPERDTPALLSSYMQAFDPDFLGLSGSADQTAQVAKDFKIFYQKVPSGNSYTIDHTAITYVFDTAGQLRLAWKHAQEAEQCAEDIHSLIRAEAQTKFHLF
ncbi:SCO family protein [Undibacterium sp. 5I1]|uniref:SCO family protein n=1 Tax=unclassified Undibacterium TaxID=2630295 RepID=UPI002AB4EDCE|nr:MULTISPECIES: SCO family protein [unclassified Undibacterium]MDY7540014.1 SCO family protein [Undibacterium sp. 5I1]MEB0232480.1 SCO family protein [Undibacterium sp. 10I3]MEB0257861.1 SCO family protein [Undibacterium sp. 5I1]